MCDSLHFSRVALWFINETNHFVYCTDYTYTAARPVIVSTPYKKIPLNHSSSGGLLLTSVIRIYELQHWYLPIFWILSFVRSRLWKPLLLPMLYRICTLTLTSRTYLLSAIAAWHEINTFIRFKSAEYRRVFSLDRQCSEILQSE